MKEHEIRFSVQPSSRASVGAWFATAGSKPESCETIYFDTDARALQSAGIELRVRRIEDRFVQTIKSSDAAGSTWVRQEDETPVASFDPSMDHLAAHMPAGAIEPATLGPLRPVFETRLNRLRVSREHKTGLVESVFDEGHILAAGRSREISEVEHELRDGKSSALATACIEFLDRSPCAIAVEGKAARGYRLWLGGEAVPVFQKRLRVESEMPIPEAVYRILTHNFAHALANLPALADTGVPASIHQMRVGLRRLRSTIYAFTPVLATAGTRNLIVGTKRIFALLGDVRDADVFVSETLPSIPPSVLPARGRRLLAKLVAAHRAEALLRLQASLAGDEFARLVVEIDAWIEDGDWLSSARPIDRLLADRPIAEFASSRLQGMHRKFVKLGRRAANAGKLEDWHKVRIMAKKLRYSGEPLLAALRDEVDLNYAKSLGRLQETLGHINDSHSVRAFLDRVRPAVPTRSRAAFAEAAAYCIGWGAASAKAASKTVGDGWRAFEAAGPALPAKS